MTASSLARSPRLVGASADAAWSEGPSTIIIGKDVLELLSTSMYVEPMTIYREYIQNSADAIDEGRSAGVLPHDHVGRVEISIDPASRTIRIRDNGPGVKVSQFLERLTALGASQKRGKSARGFRGVGRLAGLGYCQELIFRSRASNEPKVSELRWDGRKLKASLKSDDQVDRLADLVKSIVDHRKLQVSNEPQSFFEVELKGVIRHRNDRLLSPQAVADYLAQVAPVPFSPDFGFGSEIAAALRPHVALGELQVHISGIEGPVFRPHGDQLEIDDGEFDPYTNLEVKEVHDQNGGIAAVGWILHHGYTGAIPNKALVKGLRVRSGNIQVGDNALLEELFPEARFNSWTVGEVHIVDRRVLPNGRRDHFEQSVHFDNILNHLGPIGREIAKRCRTSSIRRNKIRDFELQEATVKEKLAIIAQGGIGERERNSQANSARRSLAAMEKIAILPDLADEPELRLKARIEKLERKIVALDEDGVEAKSPLASLPKAKREMYEHLIELVYECSVNRSAAKSLVDRILHKVGSAGKHK